MTVVTAHYRQAGPGRAVPGHALPDLAIISVHYIATLTHRTSKNSRQAGVTSQLQIAVGGRDGTIVVDDGDQIQCSNDVT